MKGFARTSEGDRIQWWPVRLKWSAPFASNWFIWHGWQTGSERSEDGSTGSGCMPGFRRVFGRTFHLGRLKICFGKNIEPACQVQAPP